MRPLRDDDGARADGVHLLEQVGRDDDRLFRRQRVDEGADLVLLVGVEPVGRLVEDQHRGIVQERLRQSDAALVALRQRLDRLRQHGMQRRPLDRKLDDPARVGAVEAADPGDEAQERRRRHVGIARRALGQVADRALGRDRIGDDVVPAHDGGAGGRREKARDHLHRRRFAGAVRAEEPQHLAARHLERHAVDGQDRAEAPMQLAHVDHRVHAGPVSQGADPYWPDSFAPRVIPRHVPHFTG